jgi:biopolymer transport protein ExbD
MAQAVSSPLSFGGPRDVPPMSEINTTPLIDVMLVLLIMFIITVPVQTHEVEMALPGGVPESVEVNPIKNELRLAANGKLSWNGNAIDDRQLAGALAQVVSHEKQPEVHFRPDAAARYDRVDQVLAIAAKSGAESFGFVGNEQYGSAF